MNKNKQTVSDVLNEMAIVTAKYLDYNEVEVLRQQWQGFDQVSVKMMQQCMLDTMRLYPHLQPYKSNIRRRFWQIVQAKVDVSSNSSTKHTQAQHSPEHIVTAKQTYALNNVSDTNKTSQSIESEIVSVFYTVTDAIKAQLNEHEIHNVFTYLHRLIQKERTFKGHNIDAMQFIHEKQPKLSDDSVFLNNLVQLIYLCLCEVVGPSKADNILYRSAEVAKQQYPVAMVASLF